MEQIVQHNSQVRPDYVDNLLPGYRFCPTDSELILFYLKRKIETGEHPKCRIYEVNLYDYSPEQLAGNHRACDDKWYFLTSRERKYANGDVPNRKTGDFGLWKTTQKYTPVYDDATGREVVGRKRSLAYYVKKDCKTPWLMHEYTMDDPNLPVGSDKKVLTEWVLCTIYMKKKKTTVDFSLRNNTGEHQQNNSKMSITTNSPQLSHVASASTSILPHANGASSSTLFEQHLHPIQPLAYASSVSQPIVTTTNSSFQFSNGASSSTLFELHHALHPLPYASAVSQPIVTTPNSNFQFPNGASSSTSFEPYTHHDAQPPACTSTLTSIKRFLFSDESCTTGLVADEDIMDFDVTQFISYEELLGPQSDP